MLYLQPPADRARPRPFAGRDTASSAGMARRSSSPRARGQARPRKVYLLMSGMMSRFAFMAIMALA